MEKQKQEEGICPKCGAKLDYFDTTIDGDVLFYDWECPNCETRGNEGYSLKFIGHEIY